MESESDGRGEGIMDACGLTFPDLEDRLWVPPSDSSGVSNGHSKKGEETGVNKLSDPDIDKFLIVSRSVGTFARALDCSSSVKQPSLHMSAAAASR